MRVGKETDPTWRQTHLPTSLPLLARERRPDGSGVDISTVAMLLWPASSFCSGLAESTAGAGLSSGLLAVANLSIYNERKNTALRKGRGAHHLLPAVEATTQMLSQELLLQGHKRA